MCPRSSGEYFIRGNLFLEFPLEGMAFGWEAKHPGFFEDSDGAEIVIKALGGDHLDAGRLKSPVDHPTRHLGGISLPFIGRNDIVANLHPACLVRRAVEPDAADRYLVRLMENNAVPNKTQRVLLQGALPHKNLSLSAASISFPPILSWSLLQDCIFAHQVWSRRGTWPTLQRKKKMFHEASRDEQSVASTHRSLAAYFQRREAWESR